MARINPLGLSALLNSLLRMLGFQLVRVHTLEKPVSIEQRYIQLEQTEDPMGFPAISTNDALEIRLAELESRSKKSIQDLIRYSMKAHWRTVDMIDRISERINLINVVCAVTALMTRYLKRWSVIVCSMAAVY
ncbi:hypothetical protein [Laribacter hongkongensis]|uniref:hypothetical protein n=1 Tax=Laribacter hongkongensis TaxID=168471 RepID=UPI001EFDA8C3|nr:hypothetical protein [Laribacter hongkongensis]MCG9082786.1 hypothetical protein [Laribacter hongkongensis]